MEDSPYKIYVDVNVEFTKEGELIPKVIHWSDDKTYEIQKITDIRRAASLTAGATGIRYTIYVEGYESHLYYGDDHGNPDAADRNGPMAPPDLRDRGNPC